jgi:ADP-heptose:LPS heptosyltransferase
MIEPTVKRNSHSNKAWVDSRWQELVDSMPGLKFVQCGPDPALALRGVTFVPTPRFRIACAVLKHARAFVGTEGGLMHAAAAVDTRAVILWSEFIDPSVTGYANHHNIRHAGKSCGMRLPCPTCVASMEAISVNEVRTTLIEALE